MSIMAVCLAKMPLNEPCKEGQGPAPSVHSSMASVLVSATVRPVAEKTVTTAVILVPQFPLTSTTELLHRPRTAYPVLPFL